MMTKGLSVLTTSNAARVAASAKMAARSAALGAFVTAITTSWITGAPQAQAVEAMESATSSMGGISVLKDEDVPHEGASALVLENGHADADAYANTSASANNSTTTTRNPSTKSAALGDPIQLQKSAITQNPLVKRLQAANFKCVTKAVGLVCTAGSHKAVGFSTYPDPIVVLIPAGTRQSKNIVLYLHGFRGICPTNNATAEDIERDWQLIQQMISGGFSDSIMLFPMSRGRCATYTSYLVPQFKNFTDWGAKLIQPTQPTWIVAGHSGAGAQLANALSSHPQFTKKTEAVFLLDATYGMDSLNSPQINKWVEITRHNPNIKIYSRYINGTSPASGSKNLKARLPNHVDSAVSVAARHCSVPRTEIENLLRKTVSK